MLFPARGKSYCLLSEPSDHDGYSWSNCFEDFLKEENVPVDEDPNMKFDFWPLQRLVEIFGWRRMRTDQMISKINWYWWKDKRTIHKFEAIFALPWADLNLGQDHQQTLSHQKRNYGQGSLKEMMPYFWYSKAWEIAASQTLLNGLLKNLWVSWISRCLISDSQ